jgi:hypothetical protein
MIGIGDEERLTSTEKRAPIPGGEHYLSPAIYAAKSAASALLRFIFGILG